MPSIEYPVDPIQYPGYMEPGSVVAVDLKEAATTTYFPTGDQVDCGDPDSDCFDYYAAEPGYPAADTSITTVPVLLVTDVPQTYYSAGDQVDTGDQDPDSFEYHVDPEGDVLSDTAENILTEAPDYDQDQRDFSDPDFDPFEYCFDPGYPAAGASITTVPVDFSDLATTYFPAGDQLDTGDPDPDNFAYAFDPVGDQLADVVGSTLNDSPDYNVDQVDWSDPDSDNFDYAFEPWVDLSVVGVIWDSSYDFGISQPNNDEDDPVVEYSFEPWTDHDIDFLQDTDFESSWVAQDEDDSIFEFYFEPWTAIPVVLTDIAFDFDLANQIDWSDSDPDSFDYSIEPWTDYGIVQINDSSADFDFSDQADTGDADPDPFDYYAAEPWSPVPVDLQEVATNFSAGDQTSEDPDPDSFNYWFEPWIDISAIIWDATFDFDIGQIVDEDEITANEQLLDGIDVSIVPSEFDTVALGEEEEFQLFEASMEAWVDANVEAPAFDSSVLDEDEVPIQESFFEPWVSVVTIINDTRSDYDTTQTPNDEDDPIFEYAFEPWTDYGIDTLSQSGWVYDYELQVEPVADPDCFDYAHDPWASVHSIMILAGITIAPRVTAVVTVNARVLGTVQV